MRSIFFFLLVPLLKGISGDEIFEQKEIASETDLENEETLNEIVITTAPVNPTKKPNYNEVKKSFVKQNKHEGTREQNKVARVMVQRKSRNTGNDTYFQGMECLSCHGDGISTSDLNCYRASQVSTQKCADFEQCFTELHPLYIKRGCILPMNTNRTFVCKCPLCNDKPSQDSTYYKYSSSNDWSYDNKRLEKPITGLDLLCKYCETRGVKPDDDTTCKEGRNADYTICGKNQLCYTNIDSEISFVSRGCVDLPAYNSIYYYCNKTKCNNEVFKPPPPEKQILIRKLSARKVGDAVKDEIAESKASFDGIDNVWQILVIIVYTEILF